MAGVLTAVPLLLVGGIPIGPLLIAQLVILMLAGMFRSRAHPGLLAGPPRLLVATSVFVVLGLVEWIAPRPGLPV